MNIQQIRRANLRKWTANNPVPSKEKNYFSQLLGAISWFGEQAARRLEKIMGWERDILITETVLIPLHF